MAEAPEWQRKALVLLDELGSNILNQHDLLKAAAWVIECWGQPEDKYIHPDMGKAIERLAAEAQKLREAVDRVRQANPDYDLPSASAES